MQRARRATRVSVRVRARTGCRPAWALAPSCEAVCSGGGVLLPGWRVSGGSARGGSAPRSGHERFVHARGRASRGTRTRSRGWRSGRARRSCSARRWTGRSSSGRSRSARTWTRCTGTRPACWPWTSCARRAGPPRALGSRALVHEVFPLQAAARRKRSQPAGGLPPPAGPHGGASARRGAHRCPCWAAARGAREHGRRRAVECKPAGLREPGHPVSLYPAE